MAKKKKAKKKVRRAAKKPLKKAKKTYEHHPHHYNTSETFLTQDLDEDLKDAWIKLRAFGESLGQQRIYASGRAIMFSKKVCYFFVRPQKKYLEVVVFLTQPRPASFYKSIRPITKVKYAHTFRLIHSDQVEDELIEAIQKAYDETPH